MQQSCFLTQTDSNCLVVQFEAVIQTALPNNFPSTLSQMQVLDYNVIAMKIVFMKDTVHWLNKYKYVFCIFLINVNVKHFKIYDCRSSSKNCFTHNVVLKPCTSSNVSHKQ